MSIFVQEVIIKSNIVTTGDGFEKHKTVKKHFLLLLLLLLLTEQYLKCRTHGRDQSHGHLTEVRTKSVI